MKSASWPRIVGGLLALVPALVALYASYVGPTIATVGISLRRATLLTDGVDVGGSNYEALGRAGFGSTVLYSVQLAGLPLLTALVLAPALAYAAHRTGRAGRWTVRIAFVVPLVCFAPAALAVAWAPGPDSPAPGWADVILFEWLSTCGLVCGGAAMLYLAALRNRAARIPWVPVLVVAGVLLAAIVAGALQTFDYPHIVTQRQARAPGLDTPLTSLYRTAFINASFGGGAAMGSILLAALAALGVAAVALIIATRARIEIDPRTAEPTGQNRLVAALGGALLVAVLALTLYGLWPWLSRIGATDLGAIANDTIGGLDAGRVAVNTWAPSLVSTVVGVLLAAFAGFGIGGLRPLGRWSELLLLPFAPWLFVGLGPLSVAHFRDAVDDAELNTFVGLLPPSWLPIPALLVFTLVAHGLRRRWRGRRAAGTSPAVAALESVATGLPMLALVGLATWLVKAQDTLWPLVAALEPGHFTGPALLHFWAYAYYLLPAPLGVALPLAAIVVLAVALAVLQVTYLDRIALRTGADASALDPVQEDAGHPRP